MKTYYVIIYGLEVRLVLKSEPIVGEYYAGTSIGVDGNKISVLGKVEAVL